MMFAKIPFDLSVVLKTVGFQQHVETFLYCISQPLRKEMDKCE